MTDRLPRRPRVARDCRLPLRVKRHKGNSRRHASGKSARPRAGAHAESAAPFVRFAGEIVPKCLTFAQTSIPQGARGGKRRAAEIRGAGLAFIILGRFRDLWPRSDCPPRHLCQAMQRPLLFEQESNGRQNQHLRGPRKCKPQQIDPCPPPPLCQVANAKPISALNEIAPGKPVEPQLLGKRGPLMFKKARESRFEFTEVAGAIYLMHISQIRAVHASVTLWRRRRHYRKLQDAIAFRCHR